MRIWSRTGIITAYIAHHAKPLDAHSHTLYDACIIMFRAACCCKDPGPHNHIRMHGEQGSPFSHDIRDPLVNFRDPLFCSMYEHGWKIRTVASVE